MPMSSARTGASTNNGGQQHDLCEHYARNLLDIIVCFIQGEWKTWEKVEGNGLRQQVFHPSA